MNEIDGVSAVRTCALIQISAPGPIPLTSEGYAVVDVVLGILELGVVAALVTEYDERYNDRNVIRHSSCEQTWPSFRTRNFRSMLSIQRAVQVAEGRILRLREMRNALLMSIRVAKAPS